MNMTSAPAALFFVAVGLLPAIVDAQTAPVTLDNAVSRGQTVVIVDQTGAKVKGRVADVSSTEIVLLTPDRRMFARDTVARITRIDGVWNGALIGAAIGLAPAIGIWIAGACGGDYANSDRNCLLGAAFLAGGALGGAAMDAAISKTVYRSARTHVKIVPKLSPSQSSLAVRIGF